ncbi:MAG TPA: helix-turn-helix domain-containing protein [Steroidobacter sp.]
MPHSIAAHPIAARIDRPVDECTRPTARMPAPLEPLPESLEILATRTEVAVSERLYSAGEAADAWYRLMTGAACECIQTADGRRQIVDFLLPGDLFGFCSRARHECSVQIIAEGTSLARYPRRYAEELASLDPEVAQVVRRRAFESISRLQSRTVLLGRTNALEKISAFLLEMIERTSAGASDDLVLPMSRYDIADYLAMAVETVSRALTTLKALDAITLANSRQVRITDRDALESRARGRRFLFEAARRPQSTEAPARPRTCARPSTPDRQETTQTSCS